MAAVEIEKIKGVSLDSLWVVSGRIAFGEDVTHVVEAADRGPAQALFEGKLTEGWEGDGEPEIYITSSCPLEVAIEERVMADE